MWFFALITLCTQSFTAAVFFFIPAMERKGWFFGKRSAPTPEISTLLARWHGSVVLVTAATVAGAVLCFPRAYAIVFIVAQPVALSIAWLAFRARFTAIPPEPVNMNVREATLKREPDPTRGVTQFLTLAPIVVAMISIAILAAMWDIIPEKYPIHWNLRGDVDGWGGRSMQVFQMPILSALTWIFLLWALRSGAFEFMPARRRFGFTLLIAGIMWGLVLDLCIMPMMLPFMSPHAFKLPLVLWVFTPFIMLLLLLPVWMKFSPRLPEEPPATPAEIKRDDDRFWHFGFYCNPDDPATWVERRFGAGSTPNMAHKEGRIFLAVCAGFVVVVIGFLLMNI